MKIGPFTLTRTATLETAIEQKALTLRPLNETGGWATVFNTVRESFTGAWQRDIEVSASTVLNSAAVYSCVSLIAGDIAKLCLRLVQKNDDGIWEETDSPAFSPVLRKPNRYQTIVKFVEQWIVSKLTRGNTYVLKQRDNRGVVTALYVLDPSRVTVLVTPDGAVYYEIKRDDLSGLTRESVIIPASEIIHDIMCALWHPLIGVTPIYACGVAALQGLAISRNSQKFFTNGAFPGGFLSAPGHISDETAVRLKATIDAYSGDNAGKWMVGGDGLKPEPMTMTAVDSQLIEQLKWTAETVCSCYHVPPYMIGIGPPPPYANIEPLLQQYFAQCIQTLLTSFETCLDEGLGITEKIQTESGSVQYGVEFDIDDLIWMDTATRTKAAADGINSGGMSPDEARLRYLNLGTVPGGDTPYMQQQYWPLKQLAEREIQPVPVAPSEPVGEDDDEEPDDIEDDGESPDDEDDDFMAAATFGSLLLKGLELDG